jgi:hypothetical protein
MSTSIDAAFIKQYEADVHAAYQRKGSHFRGLVRTSTKGPGADITFQKVGKGSATTKTRHGDVPPMNVNHTPVACSLTDYYAGDFIDKLDQLKTNIPEMQVTVEAGAWALGRKTDELINTALDGATGGTNTAVNLSAITTLILAQFIARQGVKDVPVGDGNLYVACTWLTWAKINSLQEFSNSQWVGPDQLPFKTFGQAKMFAGAMWFPTSAPTIASNVANIHCWHKNAVGHGIGADVQSDITWQGTKAAHWAMNMMSQGAVLIDDVGVERLRVTENA